MRNYGRMVVVEERRVWGDKSPYQAGTGNAGGVAPTDTDASATSSFHRLTCHIPAVLSKGPEMLYLVREIELSNWRILCEFPLEFIWTQHPRYSFGSSRKPGLVLVLSARVSRQVGISVISGDEIVPVSTK